MTKQRKFYYVQIFCQNRKTTFEWEKLHIEVEKVEYKEKLTVELGATPCAVKLHLFNPKHWAYWLLAAAQPETTIDCCMFYSNY